MTDILPVGHTLGVRKKSSKAALQRQREELLELRGDRTQEQWAAELGVGLRTYIRYELGERTAPAAINKLARLIRRKPSD